MLRWRFDERVRKQMVGTSRSRLVIRCAKHPRFNPAEGQGAIRGNCSGCLDAVTAYTAALKLQQSLFDYLRVTEQFETHKSRSKAKTPEPSKVKS